MRACSIAVTLVAACSSESHTAQPDGGGLDARASDGGGPDRAAPPDSPSSDDAAAAVDASPPRDGGSARCSRTSECMLIPASCCGRCGEPTATDMIALHRDDVASNRARVCATDAGPVGCPECAGMPDPLLRAICDEGACRAVNLATEDITVCASDADCVISPAQCCGCGELSVHDSIAYNPMRGSVGDFTCDDDMAPCPPCVPDERGVIARCEAGRCVVRERPDAGL